MMNKTYSQRAIVVYIDFDVILCYSNDRGDCDDLWR